MDIRDAITNLRFALQPFAAAGRIVDALEEYATADTWRTEALAAKDKALAEVAEAEKRAVEVASWCVAEKQRCEAECAEYARSCKSQAEKIVSDAGDEASHLVFQANETVKPLRVEVDRLTAECADLHGLVADLSATKQTLETDLAALKAKFGA